MRSVASRLAAAAILAVGLWAMVVGPVSASTRQCPDPDGCVLVTPINGFIDPVIVDHLESIVASLDDSDGYLGLVLVLDSQGVVVDDEAFADLADTLLESKVPVSVWVGPSGAEAIGGAAELVAVLGANGTATSAPATATGEAGKQRLPGRFGDLFAGDASLLRTTAVSAEGARRAGITSRVDAILGDHVLEIEGVKFETVKDSEGRPKRAPETAGITQTLPLASQLFHTVASPAVAYLLLSIGIGLLLFEFFTAGVGVAGVIGAFSMLLSGYGLGVLPTRGWAIGLCLFAALAFAIDIQTALPRVWTVVGLVAWTAGSLFLLEGMRPPWLALATGVGGMAVTMLSGMPAMVRSRFGTPTIGRSALVGREGVATTAVDPEGIVEIDGARWRALTNRSTPLAEGDPIRVVAIDGLTLEVEPLEGGAIDYREKRGKRGADDAEAARDL